MPAILGVGRLDARGIFGSAGVARTWSELGAAPPGTGRTLRELFGVADPMFRRLDRVARAMVLATEAAGARTMIPAAARPRTGVVFESTRGSLDTDLQFERARLEGTVHPHLFPYTLPSTGLGELAIRHRLRGPTLYLSTASADERGEALREAARWIEDGDAPFVVVGSFEVLASDEIAGVEPALDVVVALLAETAALRASLLPWSEVVAARDPFALLAARLPMGPTGPTGPTSRTFRPR